MRSQPLPLPQAAGLAAAAAVDSATLKPATRPSRPGPAAIAVVLPVPAPQQNSSAPQATVHGTPAFLVAPPAAAEPAIAAAAAAAVQADAAPTGALGAARGLATGLFRSSPTLLGLAPSLWSACRSSLRVLPVAPSLLAATSAAAGRTPLTAAAAAAGSFVALTAFLLKQSPPAAPAAAAAATRPWTVSAAVSAIMTAFTSTAAWAWWCLFLPVRPLVWIWSLPPTGRPAPSGLLGRLALYARTLVLLAVLFLVIRAVRSLLRHDQQRRRQPIGDHASSSSSSASSAARSTATLVKPETPLQPPLGKPAASAVAATITTAHPRATAPRPAVARAVPAVPAAPSAPPSRQTSFVETASNTPATTVDPVAVPTTPFVPPSRQITQTLLATTSSRTAAASSSSPSPASSPSSSPSVSRRMTPAASAAPREAPTPPPVRTSKISPPRRPLKQPAPSTPAAASVTTSPASSASPSPARQRLPSASSAAVTPARPSAVASTAASPSSPRQTKPRTHDAPVTPASPAASASNQGAATRPAETAGIAARRRPSLPTPTASEPATTPGARATTATTTATGRTASTSQAPSPVLRTESLRDVAATAASLSFRPSCSGAAPSIPVAIPPSDLALSADDFAPATASASLRRERPVASAPAAASAAASTNVSTAALSLSEAPPARGAASSRRPSQTPVPPPRNAYAMPQRMDSLSDAAILPMTPPPPPPRAAPAGATGPASRASLLIVAGADANADSDADDDAAVAPPTEAQLAHLAHLGVHVLSHDASWELQVADGSPPLRRPRSQRSPRGAATALGMPALLHWSMLSMKSLPQLAPAYTTGIRLTHVHLDANFLTALPSDFFRILRHLVLLDLSENGLLHLPSDGLASCVHLQYLLLRDNQLITLPKELSGCTALRVLDVSRNAIATLAPHLFAPLRALQTLNVAQNQLTALPPSLGLLDPADGAALRMLILDGNRWPAPFAKMFVEPLSYVNRANSSASLVTPAAGGGALVSGAPVGKSLEARLAAAQTHLGLSGAGAASSASAVGLGGGGSRGSLVSARGIGGSVDRALTDLAARTWPSGPEARGTPPPPAATVAAAAVVPLRRLLAWLRDAYDLDVRVQAFGALTDPVARSADALSPARPDAQSPAAASPSDETVNPASQRKRRQVLLELLSTEETYVQQLSALRDLYVKPLVLEPSATPTFGTINQAAAADVLPVAEARAIFANLEAIFACHAHWILPELRQAVQAAVPRHTEAGAWADAVPPEADARLGPLFVAAAERFAMYAVYLNNYDAALTYLNMMDAFADGSSGGGGSGAGGGGSVSSAREAARDGGKRAGGLTAATLATLPVAAPDGVFVTASMADGRRLTRLPLPQRKRYAKKLKAFMAAAKAQPQHTQISLPAFLILPVQRLLRYRLLLDQIMKYTPTDHPDHAQLARAIAALGARIVACNELKRQSEVAARVQEITSHIQLRPASVGKELLLPASDPATATASCDGSGAGQPPRRFVRCVPLRVVKLVEWETRAPHADPCLAVGAASLDSAQPRFRRVQINAVVETWLGKKFPSGSDRDKASEAADDGAAGVPGTAAHTLAGLGLHGASGRDLVLMVFTDCLALCRALTPAAAAARLPRAATHTAVTARPTSSHSHASHAERETASASASTTASAATLPMPPGGLAAASASTASLGVAPATVADAVGLAALMQQLGIADVPVEGPPPDATYELIKALRPAQRILLLPLTASLDPAKAPAAGDTVLRVTDGETVVYARGKAADLALCAAALYGPDRMHAVTAGG
ncbi:hypothetical protein CXG81DRAFT_19588 [Caulochytrium protostelioides]|uniref:DH domain-containing protein n=1 Tax=Caulochytrium protostelioides TaxID=1555241 RepID=A0A4P9X5Q6_9FUNG|nr:hypothetical protein CXG81DRAFT_19588 [Caulochytrium protostelioides]|eukprot:RKP00477.1 hypothetical protein CXG81DRAFT_19588 [Caulochytrium protostelioides]